MTDRVPAALLSTRLLSGESDVSEDSEDSIHSMRQAWLTLVDLACNTTFDLSADEHIKHAPIQTLHAAPAAWKESGGAASAAPRDPVWSRELILLHTTTR